MKNPMLIFPILLILLMPAATSGQPVNQPLLPLTWELGYATGQSSQTMKWIPATVPGAVQLDVAKAENYNTWYYGENWKDYLWMEDSYFIYRTSFSMPAIKSGERVFFYSGGIDYVFDILLNDEKLFQQEGMFTPVKIELTSKLKSQNVINVVIHPVPKSRTAPADRSQADHSVKPAVSYGWDWHPRLVPSGIWDETGLVIEPESSICETRTGYQLNDKLDKADISIVTAGRNLKGLTYSWTLTDGNNNKVLQKEGICSGDSIRFTALLNNPELWWPHDQGKPTLYTSRITIRDHDGKPLQSLENNVGFRRVRLVMNTLSDPEGFPKSRRLPPVQVEVNGRRVFCKGTNWVNPEVFPGIIKANRYEELIDRALEANFNMFRVWGGGIVNKESFYDLCDRKGILVWQEFPLACNNYPDDPHYLEILKQESASIILRLKQHPSLAIWCGGNELFNSWSGMNDQSLALRLLNSLCLELDPQTPFMPTSPLEGMGHGHYIFRDFDSGEEVFARMNRSRFTAYTEFGMPAPASVEVLNSIIPPGELWPPAPGGSWESHHAYKAWVGNTWLMQEMIEDYFGKSASLEELVRHGQLLQGEGYKYIFEEARRQKPFCSMALNWCYNEPWPTAANNSLLSWPNIPKPGFYQVRNACRPVLASAALQKFVWAPGESFVTSIWMLNDSPQLVSRGKVKISLAGENENLDLGIWEFNDLKPNENLKGQEFTISIPDWNNGQFKLLLEVEGRPELNSEYIMLINNEQ
ncbi:MAG TPA: glycoside hydrolase family 2 TIM barrel-domain containing protein [Bacteroidales bacterium]|nr:glycoside hydrolase family 2 TIM barrel-domain containing protein [Bacteroidales bacterium]